MANFDYGNARLRAHMANMVGAQTLVSLAQSASLQILAAGLAKTPYRKSVERAQTHTSGISLLESVLSEEVQSSVRDLLTYYSGRALSQVKILLAYEDLQNLKIVLRGIQKKATEPEIGAALLEWGSTPPEFMREVAVSRDMNEAVVRLAILGNQAAQALSTLSEEQLQHSAEVDYALERWFFDAVLSEAARNTSKNLLWYYRMRADMLDILTIAAKFLYPAFFQGRDASVYLLAKGNIPLKTLQQSVKRPSLKQAFITLKRTAYFDALRPLLEQTKAITLAEIDRRLRNYVWDWVKKQPHRDPLGIGVPIGFINAKKKEVECLRYIARSIQLGLQPDCIVENMEIPA